MTVLLPWQCRAARGALVWTQGALAHEASVAVSSVQRFEGGVKCCDSLPGRLRAALEKGGAVISLTFGVNLRPSTLDDISDPALADERDLLAEGERELRW